MPSKKTDAIIPQAKLLRLFQIIAVLKTGKWSIKSLAQRFDTSERTIYRYLKLLEEVEFLIDKDFDNNYFILSSEDEPGNTEFTMEEMKVIKKLIQNTGDNPMKGNLLKKLSLNSELDKVPRLIVKARLGKLVEQISLSIRHKKQVVLKNYHSANSSEIGDRLVEPIAFGDNYNTIVALDTRDKHTKQFKLDRIGEVIDTGKAWENVDLHQHRTADIFGMTGSSTTWITLHLRMRAYLLLREDHPLSIPYLEKTESGEYQFHGPVSNFEGVGRFVLGLIDEIKVGAPAEFKEFIQGKIKNRLV